MYVEFGIDGFGEDAGGRGLANAAGSGEEVRVGDAVRHHGSARRIGDVFLSDDVAKTSGSPLSIEDGTHVGMNMWARITSS